MKEEMMQVVTATRCIVEQAKQAVTKQIKTSGNQRALRDPKITDSRFDIA